MCGIVGIYSFKKNIQHKEAYLRDCLMSMRHRGPDSDGIWGHQNYITGFVRLAIRDLSPSGNQPMISECGNYCITFNGEIFNAEKFVQQLKQRGVHFKSTSDTEVLLYSLIHFGKDFVLREFDGMFAFAFYNVLANELLLARDRVGIKPLYIGFNKQDDVIFSSQYDHIIRYDNLRYEGINQQAVGNYLQLGYMSPKQGIIKNTIILPHGHYATITNSGFHIHQYYLYNSTHTKNELEKGVTESLIEDVVKSQLISDVPVGSFLSGGVDSSLITLKANQVQTIQAFTIGTNDPNTDEKAAAAWFANKFNIEHHIKSITEVDLVNTIDANFKAYSEPFADFSSIPTLLVAEHASKKVKVVLSGDGPDELFWGYQRNLKMLKKASIFYTSDFNKLINFSLGKLKLQNATVDKRMLFSRSFANYYYKSLFTYGGDIWISSIFKEKPSINFFQSLLDNLYSKATYDDTLNIVRDIEMNIHLQRILLKVDRASMFHSLEARVPYLSNPILDASIFSNAKNCIQNNVGKYNIKTILAKSTGEDYVFKQKKGFLIPMHLWIRDTLSKDVTESILNMPTELADAFDLVALKKLLNAHMKNGEDFSGIIWAVYALVKWYNYHRVS